MAWRDDEDAGYGGITALLYEFVAPNNTYRYTDHTAAITYSSNVYTPIVISNGNLQSSHMKRPGSMSLKIQDLSNPMIQAFGFGVSEYSIDLTVYLIHLETMNASEVFSGTGIRIRVVDTERDSHAQISCPTRLAIALNQEFGHRAMSQCQHQFGDSLCGIVPAVSPGNGYLVETTVASIVDEVTINVTSDDGNPDDTFRGGVITHVDSGEQRTIISHVGNQLVLEWGFPDISATDDIELVVRCDRRLATCTDTFSNSNAFTGAPFMPRSNPFDNPYGIKGSL